MLAAFQDRACARVWGLQRATRAREAAAPRGESCLGVGRLVSLLVSRVVKTKSKEAEGQRREGGQGCKRRPKSQNDIRFSRNS